MKLKNVLLTGLSFVLVAAVAIGGTLAYLTSTDDDVNVMTLGNVKIEQIEQERNANGELVDFTQAKPLYPYVGEVAWNDNKININGHDYNMFGEKLKNAQDKIVSVKNTGNSDAYVRTWIALEDPFTTSLLGVNVGGVGYTQTPWTTATIDGVQYSVTCFTYDEALKPGNVSLPSLLQVYLKYTATNEDVALLGDTFEVLAFSQAVQTNGFADAKAALDTAFGTDHPWTDGVSIPTVVGTADELVAALNAGGEVILSEDLDLGETQITIPAGVTSTLNLNGHDIDAVQNGTTTYGTFAVSAGATLNVVGNGDVTVNTNVTNGISACIFQNDGTLNIYGGNYEANQATSVAGLQAVIAVIDNCPYNSEAVVNIYDGMFAVTGNGAINLIRNWPIHADGKATLNIYGGTFKANPERATTYIWNKDDSTPDTLNSFMNFYGGTYEANVVYEDYNGQDDIYVAEGVNIQPYSENN